MGKVKVIKSILKVSALLLLMAAPKAHAWQPSWGPYCGTYNNTWTWLPGNGGGCTPTMTTNGVSPEPAGCASACPSAPMNCDGVAVVGCFPDNYTVTQTMTCYCNPLSTPTPTPTPVPVATPTPACTACTCGPPPSGLAVVSTIDNSLGCSGNITTYAMYNDSCGNPTCQLECDDGYSQWIYGAPNCGSGSEVLTCLNGYCPNDDGCTSVLGCGFVAGNSYCCPGSPGYCAVTGGTVCAGTPAPTPVPATPTPTPVPSPACVPCYCGLPSASNVTIISTAYTGTSGPPWYTSPDGEAHSNSNYADSCGNMVCSYDETCDYDAFFGVGASVAATDMTCDPTSYTAAATANNDVGCGTSFVTCPSKPPNTGGNYWGETISHMASGGVGCGPAGSPTATATPMAVSLNGSTTLQFNDVISGETSDTPTYQNNTGTLTATLTNQSTTTPATNCILTPDANGLAQFKYSNGNCAVGVSFTLAAGGSCAMSFLGAPTSATPGNTPITGHYTLTCGANTAVVTLTETAQTLPHLQTLNPANHEFGTIAAGISSNPLAVSIANTGSLGASSCNTNPVYSSATTNPVPSGIFQISGNTCSSSVPSTGCSMNITATAPNPTNGEDFTMEVDEVCTGINSPNYTTRTLTAALGSVSSTPAHYHFQTACSTKGAYKPSPTQLCQCPANYEPTGEYSSAVIACKPVIPSLEFSKTVDANFDGFPGCGTGRVPTTYNYSAHSYATNLQPAYTPVPPATYTIITNTPPSTTVFPYLYASDPAAAASPQPIYGLSDDTRCVCGAAPSTVNSAPGYSSTLPLPASDPLFASLNKQRFLPDNYEVISAQTAALPYEPSLQHAQVPLPNVAGDNAFLGSVFNNTSAPVVCGCPNINERWRGLITGSGAPQVSGSMCNSAMALDAVTKAYTVLPQYNALVHNVTGSTQVMIPPAATPTGLIKLPMAAKQGYQDYHQRIWTCAAPLIPQLDGSGNIACIFDSTKNRCDDGTAAGVNASAVSQNMRKLDGTMSNSVAADAVSRFQNTVNKRLACCVNDFDPAHPEYSQKFDCIDNATAATPNTASADFNALWGTDVPNAEGLGNGLLLTNSSGQIITGFYSTDGSRCGEFSEFAGNIQYARVNQMIMSGQQSKVAGTDPSTAISYTGTAIAQPTWLGSDPKLQAYINTKTIPTTAQQMRKCPILVRAAMKTACPGPVAAAAAPNITSYPAVPTAIQTINNGAAIRCSSAASITISLRVEQVYEIAGMAKMQTIDSTMNGQLPVTVSVSDWIKGKTAGICPSGTTVASDGSCTYQ